MNEVVDYDGAWKEALEIYLQPFLRLCFPAVAERIDWNAPVEFLDKELQDFEQEKVMPYVTSIERLGREEGRAEVARDLPRETLQLQFGQIPQPVQLRIAAESSVDQLKLWHRLALTSSSLEAFKSALQEIDQAK
jgi:hypothetical protein